MITVGSESLCGLGMPSGPIEGGVSHPVSMA
jgi:hypothetical protein